MTQVTKSTMIGAVSCTGSCSDWLLSASCGSFITASFVSSQMETIEEAAMVHGIEPDALVKEINDFLAKDLA